MLKKILSLGVVTFSSFHTVPSLAAETDPNSLKALFAPLPTTAENPNNSSNKAKIELGKILYNDKNFSLNRNVSCNSCHDLRNYGVDHKTTSTGSTGKNGDRNSPSVYNSALQFKQFWDGRADNVEAQALGPVLNPIEMGMKNDASVVERIQENKRYSAMFKKAFPNETDPVTFKNFGNAIAAFERTLITPSRFDAYLKGDNKALTAEEIKGFETFNEVGCGACHNGATLGGNMYQKIGLVKAYPTQDIGRMKVTNNPSDKFFFKVPSLRNVAKTGPYFHDGSVKSLPQAVKIMGEYQLGKELTKEQVRDISAFLVSLTGKIPVSAIR